MVTTRRANGITKPSSAATSSPTTSPPSESTLRSQSKSTPDETKTTSTSSSPLTSRHPIPAPTHSPLLPTRTELLLLTFYPLTLLLGSLFAGISPSLRAPTNTSIYSSVHQSFQPADAAPSYFAQKRNVFNVYFVKFGWAWCTAAFFAFHLLVSRGRSAWRPGARAGRMKAEGDKARSGTGTDAATKKTLQWTQEAGLQWRAERDDSDARLRRSYQALFRWLLCTAFWVVTTQWFFGPALVDRGFSLSGGVCQMAEREAQKVADGAGDVEGGIEGRRAEVGAVLTHAACKAVGGRWAGGYDISGHVFILILGSGMLWLEMLPFLLPDLKGLGIGRVIRLASASDPSQSGQRNARVADELGAKGHELYRPPSLMVDRENEPVKWTLKAYATTGALGVAFLSWWMLLMTAAFFHEWVEKVTAGVLAFGGLWAVYLLPRGVPIYRAIVGMPGV